MRGWGRFKGVGEKRKIKLIKTVNGTELKSFLKCEQWHKINEYGNLVGPGMEEEEKKWEEEVEDEGGGVGVGGQDNELFAHTINLIIKKLKRDQQACNWPLN